MLIAYSGGQNKIKLLTLYPKKRYLPTKLIRINGNKKDLKPKDNIFSSKTAISSGISHDMEYLFPYVAECCELVIECPRGDYSASAIARAVEDAEAHLLNLNVTSAETPSGMVCVALRVSHRNAGSVARSLERYGYHVVETHGGYDVDAELTALRIDELLAQMEV